MNASGELPEAVWELLGHALELYQDSPTATPWLRYHAERFEEPLRIAVSGAARTGKSTVVNAVVGEQIAPVQVADGDQVLTWYRDGPVPRATVYPTEGTPLEVPVSRLDHRLHLDLRQWQRHNIERVGVEWPARMLRYATLIDTAAPGSTSGAPAEEEADALLHLVRTVDSDPLEPLRAAQDNPAARAAPINTILILSRADEIGGGRVDALTSARLIARRYSHDPRVRALSQHVVALAGLVGYAGRTLAGPEFGALVALAGLERAALEEALLSTDRFLRTELPPGSPGLDLRRSLLHRLGIFGIRLATTLVRSGCDTQRKLSAQLVRRSGLSELRESISRDFTDRHQVLKARTALLAVERLLRTEPRSGTKQLRADLERILASAHDFRELRLLAALGTGRVRLPGALSAEAQHLLGGQGTSMAARLGIDQESSEAQLRKLAAESLTRWREQADNPVLSQDQRRAAGVVVRSCEQVLTQLAGAYPEPADPAPVTAP